LDFLVKNDKYTLTEEQLKELLLVSRVAIGVRVESEEHQDVESTSFEREAVQESFKRNKDDSIC
tara:strand:- start:43 stop:234 length:192 start_codon:yes stop_codon:yes gene_type:complete